jgi:P27 family predicted phage terminase small subunit
MASSKPQPTALKLYKGETRKERLNTKEPKPKPIAPPAPGWLDEDGKRIWDALAPKLEAIGILTEVDGAAFSALCQCYSRWLGAERALSEKGMTIECPSGYSQQRPEVAISHKYLGLLKSLMGEFGMTPSSRSRLVTAQDDADDFGELL